MEQVGLTLGQLREFAPTLTSERYQSIFKEGVTGNLFKGSLSSRWQSVGAAVIELQLQMFCLKELHIAQEGLSLVWEESLISLYSNIYQRLLIEHRELATAQQEQQKELVAFILGFLDVEVASEAVLLLVDKVVLKQSMRQLLPAELALKQYAAKHLGTLHMRESKLPSGVQVTATFSFKSAKAIAPTIAEATKQAEEALADILYDGNLPTVRRLFPQKQRRVGQISDSMREWALKFNLGDDLITRLCVIDINNETLDNLIEMIGDTTFRLIVHRYSAIHLSGAALELADCWKQLTRMKMVSTAPVIANMTSSPTRILRRMFFYLAPYQGEVNPYFAQVLKVALDGVNLFSSQIPSLNSPSPIVQPEAPKTSGTIDTVTKSKTWQPNLTLSTVMRQVHQTNYPYSRVSLVSSPFTEISTIKDERIDRLSVFLPRIYVADIRELASLIQRLSKRQGGQIDITVGDLRLDNQTNDTATLTIPQMIALTRQGVHWFQGNNQSWPWIFWEVKIGELLVSTLSFGDKTSIINQFSVSSESADIFAEIKAKYTAARRPVTITELEAHLFHDDLLSLGFN